MGTGMAKFMVAMSWIPSDSNRSVARTGASWAWSPRATGRDRESDTVPSAARAKGITASAGYIAINAPRKKLTIRDIENPDYIVPNGTAWRSSHAAANEEIRSRLSDKSRVPALAHVSSDH